MDEKKDYIMRDPGMTELARELSGLSRNAGTVGFMVKYSATKGNIKVHEEFQRYAFDTANNEYLVAIDKLLQNARFIDYFRELDERVTRLENKDGVPTEGKDDVKEKVKTF